MGSRVIVAIPKNSATNSSAVIVVESAICNFLVLYPLLSSLSVYAAICKYGSFFRVHYYRKKIHGALANVSKCCTLRN